LANQQIGQKRLKTEGAIVFVAVNDLQNQRVGHDGGTGKTEMKLDLLAIAAHERLRNAPVIRQPAPLTKRRGDKTHLRPAVAAHITLLNPGAFLRQIWHTGG